MNPERVLQACFLAATASVLVVERVPALNRRFLNYGARTNLRDAQESRHTSRTPAEAPQPPRLDEDGLAKILDTLAEVRVPHAWFKHFYVLSVILSAFWAGQLLLPSGVAFTSMARSPMATIEKSASGMTVNQVALAWALLCVQGCRRLYESLAYEKPSKATMPVIHWLLGLAFYLAMSVAVWIEGTDALRSVDSAWDILRVGAPSLRTLLFLPVFMIASGLQHDCHHHLSTLKKYTLPTHPFFQALICPHYTAECVIYVCLSVLAAPQGKLLNTTLLTALIFVAVNLGSTAETTRKFYAEKFGEHRISGRWRMIPYLY